jgi:mRNA interferase HicA
MKHVDFVRHLTQHGCVLHRQGARHEIYLNPANGNRTAVPRHREIKETTARRICDQLGIPRP